MLGTLAGIVFLLVLLFVTDVFVSVTALPIPAAIAAMAFLVLFFAWHGKVPVFIGRGAGALVRIFPLLFIPPLVGVFEMRALLLSNAFVLLLAVTFSTLVGLFVTAFLFQWLQRSGKSA